MSPCNLAERLFTILIRHHVNFLYTTKGILPFSEKAQCQEGCGISAIAADRNSGFSSIFFIQTAKKNYAVSGLLKLSKTMHFSDHPSSPLIHRGTFVSKYLAFLLMFLLVRDKGVIKLEDLAGSTTCSHYFNPSI